MSKKALMAICVAVLVPLVFFTITDLKSKGAITMPRRYYYDSIAEKMKDGKMITDTAWHQVSNIVLTNQLGNKVSLDQIKGRVIIADFFFTHCPSICPTLTRNMKKLQDALKWKPGSAGLDTSFVQFLSFSVDPTRDTAEALKKYADKYGVNHDIWWMLTGPKKTIYDFALNELKMGLQDGEGVDSNFIHTQKMVLMDKYHVVRGYYDGLDSAELSKLANDIVFIMLERDKKNPSVLVELKPLIPLMIIVMLAAGAGVYFLGTQQKKSGS